MLGHQEVVKDRVATASKLPANGKLGDTLETLANKPVETLVKLAVARWPCKKVYGIHLADLGGV